jgi:hypothetical protein
MLPEVGPTSPHVNIKLRQSLQVPIVGSPFTRSLIINLGMDTPP